MPAVMARPIAIPSAARPRRLPCRVVTRNINGCSFGQSASLDAKAPPFNNLGRRCCTQNERKLSSRYIERTGRRRLRFDLEGRVGENGDTMSLEGTLAANRFGLGAKPGEIDSASSNPKAWLLGQLRRDDTADSFSALPKTGELVQDLLKRGQAVQAMDREAIRNFVMDARQTYLQEMAVRFRHGFITDAPFRERLVRFWSNHFVVSNQKPRAARFVGAFERDAIRAHVTGRFADMVLAVERHPAMQLYLDNAQSIGPDSFAGMRTGKGLNENLGREILELHTLGVEAGYTQDDVIALAKILTGWSLDRGPGPVGKLMNAALGGTAEGGFRFYPPRHEPGEKKLLGKTYPEGFEGGVQALTDIANHPATARHIATKLAAHFIADDPPQASIARLETAFRDSGGNLMNVYEALIDD